MKLRAPNFYQEKEKLLKIFFLKSLSLNNPNDQKEKFAIFPATLLALFMNSLKKH